VVLAIAIVGATPLMVKLTNCLKTKKTTRLVLDILEIPVLLLILVVATAFLISGSFNPFLYFRF